MRYIFALIGGVIMALLLFLLDHTLVSAPASYDLKHDGTKLVDFIRLERDETLRVKDRRLPKKPPPPKSPPPPPKMEVQAPANAPRLPVKIATPNIAASGVSGSGPYLGTYGARSSGNLTMDGEVIPIVRIRPRYPRQALLQGIEGWVSLEFTILKDGSVSDVSVLEAEPARIFNGSAIQAVLRWKFKPRVVDGEAVERRGSQVIEYKLDEEA